MVNEIISQFHFVRPLWLLLLFVIPIIYWLLRHHQPMQGAWVRLIDPVLQRYVLAGSVQKRAARWPIGLAYLIGTLLILSLAGPTWERLPQPVYSQLRPMVIALDLSQSMRAQDVLPSRLQVAKIRLQDILAQRGDGQTALIAFAGDAYTVTPLTDDAQTIVALLGALSPRIMPVAGSRLTPPLVMARQLLAQAESNQGDVILLADGIADIEPALAAVKELTKEGHRVSVMAVGTAQGGLVKNERGEFLRDRSGTVVTATVPLADLRDVAAQGNGWFLSSQSNNEQLSDLLSVSVTGVGDSVANNDLTTDTWREQGPLLILLCLPFLALAFRRGVVICLFACMLMPTPPVHAGWWDDMWWRRDQQGDQRFSAEDYASASQLYESAERKAAALFRDGKFEDSAQVLEPIDSAGANYNRGNALAHAGDIKGAITAYERALSLQSDFEDAQYNLDVLKQMQQQQSDEQQDQDQEQDQEQSDEQQDSEQQDESGEGEQEEQENEGQGNEENQQPQDGEDSQESEDEQQDSEKSDEEEQEMSEQEMRLAEQLTEEEQQQAVEQWLRRVPDDPGGLLRRKFKRQAQSRRNPTRPAEEW